MKKIFSLLTAALLLVGNAWADVANWTLVESEPDDWSGEYLIVYNEGCYNGSLTSGFDQSAPVSVTISDNQISLDDKYAMIVAKVNNKYSLQTASGYYIGRNNDSNGTDANSTWNANLVVELDNWNSTNKTVQIVSKGGRCLGRNGNTWRFYASSNAYTKLSLYKKVISTEPEIITTPNELDFGMVELNSTPIAQTLTIKGRNLTDANDVTVTAPAGFKVSVGEEEPAESVVLTPSSKAVSASIIVTPITTTVGAFNGNITISSEDLAEDSVVGVKLTVLTPVAVTGVSLDHTSLTLADGDTATLIATISPDEATNKKVTWESSAEAIATVDEKGLVTAIAKGVATITCKSVADPTKLATCELTVVGPDVILDFTDNTEWQIPVGTTKTTGTHTYTAGDYSITLYGPSGNGYYYDGSDNNLMLGKTGAYMTLPLFADKVISKVVTLAVEKGSKDVTFNIFQEKDAVSTEVTGCNKDQTFVISTPKANVAHSIKVTNSNNVRLGVIKIYLSEPTEPTSISNTAVEAKAVKTIVNGQLLITRDGKTFNVLGTQVR